MIEATRLRVRLPMSLIFFNAPNPSSCTMVLVITHPLTKMSTRRYSKGKGWPASKADNLTANSGLIV
jgi:hypothetical protein